MENLTYTPTEVSSRASLLALTYQYQQDPNVDTRRGYEVWLDFRLKLLTRWEQKRGSLKCYFCGQDNLEKVTEGVKPYKQATLDHFVPRSKGGAEYDENNLVVACSKCNAKKADVIL